MRRLAKEPLLHFFVAGFLLFGIYGVVDREREDDASDLVIVVASNDIARVASLWSERWRRDPTPAELRAMVHDLIREEVLYREALAEGLAENDVIIRRRLAQKITFLTQDLAAQLEPTDAELREWFAQNIEIYEEDTLYSLTHIYFSEDERGGRAQADAQALADEFAQSTSPPERAPDRGDPFMLRPDYREVTLFEIRREFGTDFGDAVALLQPGAWHGPIRSGYGVHLVRVSHRSEGAVPPFEEVRDRVEGDWLYEQNKRVDEAYYNALLEKYELRLDEDVQAVLDSGADG